MNLKLFPKHYYAALEAVVETHQAALQKLMTEFEIYAANSGFSELIVTYNQAPTIIQRCAEQGIAISALSWWCHVTPANQTAFGCPHGFGGPVTRIGRLSECNQYPEFEIVPPTNGWPSQTQAIALHCAQQLTSFIAQQLPLEPFYRPCLQIGLALAVPDWQRNE